MSDLKYSAEEQKTNAQERLAAALTDDSLPAAQTLEAQEKAVAPTPAPRFIP